ncbi:MAG: ACP S-malonyltransferase, partial [Chloroflexota bacterium]|nr:ACP S-malonyltransferase [Chloroflexota bacterium]
AYVFPGQGTQKVGMGYELHRSSTVARAVFDEAEKALGFSLTRLCFEGPEHELRRTINAQPAILTVSVACLRAAAEEQRVEQHPSFVAGHSVGEYSALVAAGVLDLQDAVRLVRERGRLMEEAGEKRPGTMMAIMGLDEMSVSEICQQTGAEIANVNSAQQIVISGPRTALARAVDLAKAMGAKKAIPLDVSGAFHTSLMEPAVEGMAKAISGTPFSDAKVPVVVNSTALPVTTGEEIKAELLWQLCNCVRWHESVRYMIAAGVSTFVEIGPGQVLSGLIKRIDENVATVSVS